MNTLTAEITGEDKQRGYKLEHPVSWHDIIVPMGLLTPRIEEILDTLEELLPNECAVKIVDGKPSIAHWGEAKRRDEFYPWLAECHKEGLITAGEYLEINRAVRAIRP